MRLLVAVVVLRRLMEEICKRCDVRDSRRLPLAAGKPRLDLLDQPTVPVRIFERDKREVRTTFRIAPADALGLDRVVKRSTGIMENLADIDTTSAQFSARGIDVVARLVADGHGHRAVDDRHQLLRVLMRVARHLLAGLVLHAAEQDLVAADGVQPEGGGVPNDKVRMIPQIPPSK